MQACCNDKQNHAIINARNIRAVPPVTFSRALKKGLRMTTNNSRTVRIFLSGTFRDFTEERDLLVRQVFPSLRAKLKDRFVDLVDVDLRWGITSEEAERGEVLPICLSEIDRSRPYFIGMLGERYGWIPPSESFVTDLVEREEWLTEFRGDKSMTELEILHGVLRQPAMENRALFYFRSPAYAKAKGGDYLPSDEDRLRQRALKHRIRASGLPVVNYATPEALARRIERDLWNLLDAEFPASEVPDAFGRQNAQHEAYAAPRLNLYFGGNHYVRTLKQLLTQKKPRILITGPSGGGKSALLANTFANHRSSTCHVFEHYLAASSDAADASALVRRLIEFIQRVTGQQEPLPNDTDTLFESLPLWLASASRHAKRHRCRWIFVFDALNNLSSYRDLRWLPEHLPSGIQMVVSCLDGEVLQALTAKSDWLQIEVEPLKGKAQAEFFTSYLKRYVKTPPLDLLEKVLAHPLASNPLWLKTLAEELRVFGSHEELEQRLATLLGPPHGKEATEPAEVNDLFDHVLQRFETDHGKALVKDAMTSLWASRAGLSEPELLSLLSPHATKKTEKTAKPKLPSARWTPLRYALDDFLIESGGRLAFSHDYMRIAVQNRYVRSSVTQKKAHRKIADHFSNGPVDWRVAEELPWQLNAAGDHSQLRSCLLDPDIFLNLWQSQPDELFNYWNKVWALDELVRAYGAVAQEWLEDVSPRSRLDLKIALADSLWEMGIINGFVAQLQKDACTATVKRFGAQSLEAGRRYLNYASYLRILPEPHYAKLYANKALRALGDFGDSLDLVDALSLKAAVLKSEEKGWAARPVMEEAFEILDKVPDSPRKDMASQVAWLTWAMSADEHEVLSELPKQIASQEARLGREHRRTLETVDRYLVSLIRMEQWQEANNLAMSAYLRCYRVFGEDHLQTAYAAGNFGIASLHLDDLDSAEWGLLKAHEILYARYDSGHPNRTDFLWKLSELYDRTGRAAEAERLRDEFLQ